MGGLMDNILQIKNLKTSFPTREGKIYAADSVSLNVRKGQMTALVGESGSGKSVTAMSVLRLILAPGKIESGEILFRDEDGTTKDILKLQESEVRKIRGNKIAMIFQEPMTSLNPVFTVGDQIIEAIILHQNLNKKDARDKAIEMLKRVGIPNPERRVDNYPHEMSGGMRQRVMIAMGLSCHPDLLIADEPTTALDVTIQAQILELINDLMQETGMSVLLITHDLGIVAAYAQHVAVMYAGQVIEEASTLDLFRSPRHPYTKGLLASIPSLKKQHQKYLHAIPGTVPNLALLPEGCRFAERCDHLQADCRTGTINMALEQERKFRCLHPYKDSNS